MNLSSNSFKPWEYLDARLAFGEYDEAETVRLARNRNPQLAWDNVPEGTKSFALLCYDDDAPSEGSTVNKEGVTVPLYLERARFYHWVVADLPASVSQIAEGSHSDGVTAHGKSGGATPDGGVAGINDYSSWFAGDEEMAGDWYGYDGPCPPWNDERTHAYVFHLLALDVESLELGAKFGGPELVEKATGHILAEARLSGLYRINPA